MRYEMIASATYRPSFSWTCQLCLWIFLAAPSSLPSCLPFIPVKSIQHISIKFIDDFFFCFYLVVISPSLYSVWCDAALHSFMAIKRSEFVVYFFVCVCFVSSPSLSLSISLPGCWFFFYLPNPDNIIHLKALYVSFFLYLFEFGASTNRYAYWETLKTG